MSSIKDFALGYRDLSDDPEIHFMKDRVGGSVVFVPVTAAVSKILKKKNGNKKSLLEKIKSNPKKYLKALKSPKVMLPAGFAAGTGLTTHYFRGSNLAKINGVDFGLKDTLLTSTVPFYSADVAVKKKMQEKNASEVIDSLYKEAGFANRMSKDIGKNVLKAATDKNPVLDSVINNPIATFAAITAVPAATGAAAGYCAGKKAVKKEFSKNIRAYEDSYMDV